MMKIYFGERVLLLTGGDAISLTDGTEHVVSDYKDIPILLKSFVENPSQRLLVLKNDNLKALFKAVASGFEVVEAAGGAVLNEYGELLLIHRLGKWDLPKGKVELDEDLEDAAVREVEEECGISGVSVVEELCKTYHTYDWHGQDTLKVTHWYAMSCSGAALLVPQVEEDITDAVWVPMNELHQYMAGTYGNIRDVVGFLQENINRG